MSTTLLDLLIRLITLDYFVIKKIISKYQRPGLSVLDLGCGTGALAKLFPPSTYLGFDLDESSINLARSQNPNHIFRVANAIDPNLGKEKFDFILVCGVIHHLNDNEFKKTMGVIKKHLAPYGRALLIEAIPSLFKWNVMGKIIRFHDQGKHIRRLEDYVSRIKKILRVLEAYPKFGGLVDYGVILADNQLGKS